MFVVRKIHIKNHEDYDILYYRSSNHKKNITFPLHCCIVKYYIRKNCFCMVLWCSDLLFKYQVNKYMDI
jgi:hypothetical protein